MKKVRVGIVGGYGYTGGELLRLLPDHPDVTVTEVTSDSQAGRPVGELYPNLAARLDLEFTGYRPERLARNCDVVFLAKPQPNSFAMVRDLFGQALLVDLSGDFRYAAPADFERWYGTRHEAPEYLDRAVYGLPEIFADRLRGAKLVANPGCYPTGIILALFPLARRSWLEPEVTVSAVSGFSGAGRKPSPNSMAWSVAENVRPYRVGVHPHTGELEEAISRRGGAGEFRFLFVPQVAGFERGILSVISARLAVGVGPDEVRACLAEFYRAAPFVRLLGPEAWPEIRNVTRTNFCEIGFFLEPGTRRLVLLTALDNLVKGAAGQAIQNMNLALGFAESAGLHQA